MAGMDRDTRGERPEVLRFITYLSPGIPRAFFEAVVDHARRELGCRTSLQTETQVSGPERGVEDPFSRSFLWLRELRPPPVELLGLAPVFRDRRNEGRPVYFCDVIVRRDSPIRSFAELRGGSWAYNDRCSLSGYYGLLKKLADTGADGRFFDRMLDSGSHLNSIEMVARGEADAATIDSNVLAIRLRSVPELRDRLRVIESWGPFPVQPVVVRSGLHPDLNEELRAALLAVGSNRYAPRALIDFGVERFAPVTYDDYAPEALALEACESIRMPASLFSEPP